VTTTIATTIKMSNALLNSETVWLFVGLLIADVVDVGGVVGLVVADAIVAALVVSIFVLMFQKRLKAICVF
jgi:ABC-type multidrug transport system permease subunit